MGKTIIISNRLPVQLQISDGGLTAIPSVGGLATGLKSVHRDGDGLWIGWSGLTSEDIPEALEPKIDEALEELNCKKVRLTADEIEGFYFGFSNRTIWPLFHYFMEYTEFELSFWNIYKEVNRKFAEVVIENSSEDDTIWVHDYQLMLLPEMIREARPNAKIDSFYIFPFRPMKFSGPCHGVKRC